MFLGVSYSLCALKRLSELEKRWAYEDPLTGLANRRAFFQSALRELRSTRRTGKSLTTALIDVDDFKKINDRWGHEHGDKVLVWVGNVLSQNLRAGTLIARLGGDELAILLSETDSHEADRLLQAIHHSFQQASKELGLDVSVSVGAVTFAQAPNDVEAMLRAADRQMYHAKHHGKNAMVSAVMAA